MSPENRQFRKKSNPEVLEYGVCVKNGGNLPTDHRLRAGEMVEKTRKMEKKESPVAQLIQHQVG